MRVLFALFCLFVLFIMTACAPAADLTYWERQAEDTKRRVTTSTAYIENPRNPEEVLAGKACLKIRCTEPTRFPPVQP